MNLIAFIAAILVFLIAFALGFGWFGSHVTDLEEFGLLGLGSALFVAGHILPVRV